MNMWPEGVRISADRGLEPVSRGDKNLIGEGIRNL